MISARTKKTIFKERSEPSVYEILDIDKNATRLEKLKAWRKQLLRWHPDSYPTVFIKQFTEKTLIFDDTVPGAAEAREVMAKLHKFSTKTRFMLNIFDNLQCKVQLIPLSCSLK